MYRGSMLGSLYQVPIIIGTLYVRPLYIEALYVRAIYMPIYIYISNSICMSRIYGPYI